jgi:hypothetical protein
MSRLRKISALLIIAIFAVSVTGATHSAYADDQPLGLKPRPLVACADAKKCDRDPAHLTDFVVKFYAWYVDDAVVEMALTGGPSAHRQAERRRNAMLDRMLSPRFVALLTKLRKEVEASKGELPEADPSLSALCGGADADNVLCAQDFEAQWRTNASAAITAQTANSVRLTVSLPLPVDPKGEKKFPPYRLTVTMIPAKGFWRIDRIASQSD